MKKWIILLLLACTFSISPAQRKASKPQIAIVSELKYDSVLYASGYRWMIESVQNFISPIKFSDEAYEKSLVELQGLKTKLHAVNIFMPGDLKLVGPDVQEQKILDYAKQVMARCKKANIRMIVWGSGGARRVPDGFDHDKAIEQFIHIAGKVSDIAKEYNIMIALENLNSTETNFINTVKEALSVVKAVNRSNFRLAIDIYHMLKENEGPAIITQTKKYLVHCEVAERENRTPPGVVGDDFRPYLNELHKIGYDKMIFLECRWENVPTQALPARLSFQKQIDDVYK